MDNPFGIGTAVSDSGQEVAEENLLGMLRSMQPDTQLLALNLLQAIPVPKSAVTDLFAISQFARDRRLRFPAESLLGSAVPRRWLRGLLDELQRPTFRPDEYPAWFRRIRGRSFLDSSLLARYLYTWGLLSLPAYIQIGVFHPESFFHSFVHNDTLHLERLHLDFVPREIASLPAIQTVDLRRNQLTEAGRVVSKMKGVRQLILDNNQLATLSSTLGTMEHLEILQASRNQLRDLPPGLSKLARLQVLRLDENELEEWPSFMTELPALATLDLRHNRLVKLPEQIGQQTRLVRLDLSRNQVRRLPDGIGQLPALQHLNIRSNPLESLPAELNLPALESLQMGPLPIDMLRPWLRQLAGHPNRPTIHITPLSHSNQATLLPREFPSLNLIFPRP